MTDENQGNVGDPPPVDRGNVKPTQADVNQDRTNNERRDAREARLAAIQEELLGIQRRTFWVHTVSLVVLGVYAGFTLAAAIANWRAVSAAKDAASATKVAADAAKLSADTGVRAWVVPTLPVVLPETGRLQTGLSFVALRLSNVGNSPAFNLRQETGKSPVASALPSLSMAPTRNGPFSGSDEQVSSDAGFLNPDHGFKRGSVTRRNDPVAMVQFAFAEGENVFVGGWILYDDATGKNRLTEWCVSHETAMRKRRYWRFCSPSERPFVMK